ncbi:hypothetical protein EDB84DRAFT_1444622 [Lactarius hengduanensis]|nr:hypothetical protein EDB84DRAFT_1444622 [Lactarius hengduanensis]
MPLCIMLSLFVGSLSESLSHPPLFLRLLSSPIYFNSWLSLATLKTLLEVVQIAVLTVGFEGGHLIVFKLGPICRICSAFRSGSVHRTTVIRLAALSMGPSLRREQEGWDWFLHNPPEMYDGMQRPYSHRTYRFTAIPIWVKTISSLYRQDSTTSTNGTDTITARWYRMPVGIRHGAQPYMSRGI